MQGRMPGVTGLKAHEMYSTNVYFYPSQPTVLSASLLRCSLSHYHFGTKILHTFDTATTLAWLYAKPSRAHPGRAARLFLNLLHLYTFHIL